jgi:hypothetical protein
LAVTILSAAILRRSCFLACFSLAEGASFPVKKSER